MPTHLDLVLPTLRAVAELGGSAKVGEITDHVSANFPNSEVLLEATYPNRPSESVFLDRAAWGRSTAKLIGALEQPARGMYLTTPLADELLELPEAAALERIRDLDREYARQQREKKRIDISETSTPDPSAVDNETPSAEVLAETSSDDEGQEASWKSKLLQRLHALPPEGFEKFVIYLLRRYGLQLSHVGGSGDEGIDAIGTAPLSPVLSSRVAVQVKRYAPDGKPIGRETVALFQRDAQTKGAERAILVTLSRFTEPAKKAAIAATPTVDLVSGDRLADLIREDGASGVTVQPSVDESWFDRFDSVPG
ncbi:restriction endonuclease [Citricoccus sp. I39-566]|uniref:restriction endonuclease n=1 Tax=Citricoccus sp. I39-566 TaxID=3073268 RepID=UPI00286C531C|nr:restriction endonuclease [Citricoccus sp. I39-566]WMY79416.1 restriction endonuclease [Citricoccus sp. I39-566]